MREPACPAQDPDVFDRIRAICRSVAEQADHVRLRVDRIEALAAALSTESTDAPPLDTVRHVVSDEPETVAYFMTLAAVNFGSGFFPYLAKRPGMSGYFTIASRLADRFRESGPLSAEALETITPRACAQLFAQDLSVFPIRELMGLFARAWNDLGRHLIAAHGGQFEGLIEAADGSAAALVGLLSAQRFFRDVVPYRGLDVPFYKRSQLLASDLSLALGGSRLGRFDDLDRMTIFADNLVPHVLRRDGILDYAAPLAEAIERDELIRPGSEEEVEIRACAVDAVERIREAMDAVGRPTSSRQLDQLLWHRGQAPAYKAAKRHRTQTVFY